MGIKRSELRREIRLWLAENAAAAVFMPFASRMQLQKGIKFHIVGI